MSGETKAPVARLAGTPCPPRSLGRLESAVTYACLVHSGQKDKAGLPYIFHSLRVMGYMERAGYGGDVLVCAVLHDAVEDSAGVFTLETAAKVFGYRVALALDALSRRDGEAYREYIERCGRHTLARRVKIADLWDNLRPERQVPGTEGLRRRYEEALADLGARKYVEYR